MMYLNWVYVFVLFFSDKGTEKTICHEFIQSGTTQAKYVMIALLQYVENQKHYYIWRKATLTVMACVLFIFHQLHTANVTILLNLSSEEWLTGCAI